MVESYFISERQKSFSYGSVEQPKDGGTIVLCEVTVTINDKTILKCVSGMAKAGEILAIMGPSGTSTRRESNRQMGRQVDRRTNIQALDTHAQKQEDRYC